MMNPSDTVLFPLISTSPEEIDEEGDQIMDDCSSKRAKLPFQSGEPSKKPRLLLTDGISSDDPVTEVTTLLKAISLNKINPITYGTPEELKEFEEGMKELEENRVTINESGEKTGLYDDDYIDEIRVRGFDPGPESISAGPVLQIISVSIYKKKDNPDDQDPEEFGVYGYISLTDYIGNTYYIYRCHRDSPEKVSSNSNLLLKTGPVAPALGPRIKFSLTNADGTIKMFNEDNDYYLKDSDTLECEELETQDFAGEGGYVARVVFNRIPLAVMVEFRFFFGYNPDPINYVDGTTYKVRGTIKVNNVVCWKPLEGQDIVYKQICDLELSRNVFAAPLGRPVQVDISWSCGGEEFNENREFLRQYVFRYHPAPYYFPCDNEDFHFSLDMCSFEHDVFFRVMSYCLLDMKQNPNIRQLEDLPHLAVTPEDALVEVFSVLLVSDLSSAPPPLCGQIVVQDPQGKVYIFARNKERPDMYSSNEQRFKRTLSLAWPDRWVLAKDFFMYLKLKDADDNRVCRGYLSWQHGDMRFNRRLCEAIPGENGYFAAMHYSVFLNGKKAKVSVKCSEDGDQYRLVYGSIFAEYDNYDDYRSTYDKECYRIIIFKRAEEDCVKVKSGSEIPLAKTHVSAPSDCESLSVHVDLWVSQSYEPAVGNLVFKTDSSDTPQIQSCGDGLGRVTVELKWVSE